MRSWKLLLLSLLAIALSGCPDRKPSGSTNGRGALGPLIAQLGPVDLSNPIQPIVVRQPIQLRAAKNEWTSFTLQISGVVASRPTWVRIAGAGGGTDPFAVANLQAYQVLPMPVEVNPGYVRHTGLNTVNRSIPRALLPAPLENGAIGVAALRDPSQPTNSAAHPNGSADVLLWVDVHVPAGTSAGRYGAACEIVDAKGHAIGASVPIDLTVYDFTLPDQRHLQMVGNVRWSRLAALYPSLFGDTITPNLINRREARYEATVRTLDGLVRLAQRERAALIVPGLRPTVKWPAGASPEIDWSEFDALVAPWMNGQAFGDRVPLGYWPLPAAQSLGRYDQRSRIDYWSLAARHFDQVGWLASSAVALGTTLSAAPPTGEHSSELQAQAAQILAAYPRLRVTLPLEDEQLAGGPIAVADRDRVVTAAPALISAVRAPAIGAEARTPRHWLRTDLPGLVPYAGAGGDERDVRAWAWLAFLRRAELILWDQPLPSVDGPQAPADPNAMTWFYPGSWFGVAEPVPTIQLKWLRRAQQDYEYLWLARQRGEVINALQMARLITKPVEIPPGQAADPAYSLMSGTTNPQAWERAQELLAKTILLRGAGEAPDPARQNALYIETLQWAQPQERPVLMARSARWTFEGPRSGGAAAGAGGAPRGNWLGLQLGLDIYNASDQRRESNQLVWSPPPAESGWEMRPQPVSVPPLLTYHVQPATLPASFDLDQLTPDAARPIGASFIDGFDNKLQSRVVVRLPVAASDRREGPLSLDGKLEDWSEADAIQNGPLVLMLSRPDLQNQRLQFAPGRAKIYSGWGRDNFYLAFALEGLIADPHRAHNDVDYQARRAWGEDLCEAVVQPVFADNAPGAALHVVFKPNGALWIERKDDHVAGSSSGGGAWQATEGAGLRYAAMTTADGRWRGEAGIPWRLITGGRNEFPILLRFNFSQHRTANCESASWCGPVDFGRDDQLMGVLYLRTPRDLGIAGAAAAGTDKSDPDE